MDRKRGVFDTFLDDDRLFYIVKEYSTFSSGEPTPKTVESEIKLQRMMKNLTMVLPYCENQLGQILSKSIQRKLRNPTFHYEAISVIRCAEINTNFINLIWRPPDASDCHPEFTVNFLPLFSISSNVLTWILSIS